MAIISAIFVPHWQSINWSIFVTHDGHAANSKKKKKN